MLAYVFWHRPSDGVDKDAYECRLRAFHRALSVPSASFWLSALPFADRAGYEDWYLVPSWHELGELNRAAISGQRSKRPGERYDLFLDQLPAPTVWQRQMVLGPAPEFCAVDEAGTTPAGTNRIAVYCEGSMT